MQNSNEQTNLVIQARLRIMRLVADSLPRKPVPRAYRMIVKTAYRMPYMILNLFARTMFAHFWTNQTTSTGHILGLGPTKGQPPTMLPVLMLLYKTRFNWTQSKLRSTAKQLRVMVVLRKGQSTCHSQSVRCAGLLSSAVTAFSFS